jgi:pilus assembly protein Flp/PilA
VSLLGSGAFPAALPSLCRTRDGRNKEQTHEELKDDSGATAIEYGLVAALISVVIIGAVKLAGSNLSNKFNQIASNLT